MRTPSLSHILPAPVLALGTDYRARLAANPLYVFAVLVFANCSRILFPGPVTDLGFAAVILGIGLLLLGEQLPAWVRPVVLCFLALLGIYAAGLLLDFSAQGLRHTFAILAAGVVYLFAVIHGPRLVASQHFLSVLVVAGFALVLRYTMVQPWTAFPLLSSTILNGIQSCLLLTLGTLLLLRSGSRRRRHLLALLVFAMIMAIGVLYGYRALLAFALLTFPLYGLFFHVLRGWRAGLLLALAIVLAVCLMIAIIGTPWLDSGMGEISYFSSNQVNPLGGRFLSGREMLWYRAIIDMETTSWLGRGTGTTLSDLLAVDRLLLALPDEHVPPALQRFRDRLDFLHPVERERRPPIYRVLRAGVNADATPSAHNLFLQISLQTGVPGLVALLALCLSLFLPLRSPGGARVQPLQAYAATGILLLLLLGVYDVFLLQGILSWGVFAWIFIGISTGTAREHMQVAAPGPR